MSWDPELMKKNYADMLGTFLTAVDALNGQKKMRAIEDLLDENIALHRIHSPLDSGTVRGRKNVVEFLDTRVAKGKVQLMVFSPISVDSRKSTVSGSAIWQDQERGNAKEIIDYSFSFVQAADGKWRITNMYAAPR